MVNIVEYYGFDRSGRGLKIFTGPYFAAEKLPYLHKHCRLTDERTWTFLKQNGAGRNDLRETSHF